MPRKALIIKANKTPKFSSRKYTRCLVCGRSRGKVTKNLCRMDFRKRVYKGLEPGWGKGSR